ncbi:Phenylalanine--tRNA ligase alpha subunit [Segatella buccae]|uniref:Phenylalanine--tRNA ligase alpha subunit n=2 Tax=Segatella buccae TaxID=28126 RepID=A0AAQ1UHM5_9BACT|nr:Phenylalanine--tRNA ligase alpha subunit [Segatella buccae]
MAKVQLYFEIFRLFLEKCYLCRQIAKQGKRQPSGARFSHSNHNIGIMLLEKIETLLKEVSGLTAANAEEIEQFRLKYLSKKGEINTLMADFRNVAAEEKKTVGIKINQLKQTAITRINELREQLEEAEATGDDIDLTRTSYPIQLGTRHPLTIVTNDIIDIFSRMGFVLADGPEIDDDKHVFTMLNFAADHPARDMQDTFFIEQSDPNDVTKNILLRSHTSDDQAHYMECHQPPFRILCPGRVYRNEAISARAHCFFHQVEGLYVDKNVSFTDLKQVLLTFAREMFGPDTKIRLRPSYFPFTEPSAEMDISCHICGGEGCGFCKHTGWVEILGCGMVDPNVLEACGIDSSVYTGYAFGMGVERITNLKYRVSDLRMFSENDTQFLREFESAR